jgi:hypothetical protein
MAIEHLSTLLDPIVRNKALARIGYFDDTKKRGRQVDYRRLLGWFVDLATMSPQKLHERYEEVRALQEEGSGGVTLSEDAASTAAHLPKTQAKLAAYLEQLTTTGRIGFEEFTLNTSIALPRFRPGATLPYSILIGEHVEPLHGKGLLYQFFLALKSAGDRLRQCQHCATLFVQARRKQQVCSSRCRTRASRARQKERAARKTKRQRDTHAASYTRTQKGGKSHGPKTHR